MAHIRIDLPTSLVDGMDIKFKAPCDCTAVEGLLVYYMDELGEEISDSFEFYDAHGNNLTGLGNLFSAGAYVNAILDTDSRRAYLQNADTNAYLENRKISRSQLVNDALYSPSVSLNASNNNYSVSTADIGKTLTAMSASVVYTVTLSQAVSSALPLGAEIAICFMFGTSLSIVADGVRMCVPGESSSKKNVTLSIPEPFNMVAIKKMYADAANGDMWLVTGNVEVVS